MAIAPFARRNLAPDPLRPSIKAESGDHRRLRPWPDWGPFPAASAALVIDGAAPTETFCKTFGIC
nr:MAG TPA: hypothetical protein [Caudoviricetes sp.]DAT51275.1 MAG TPA: hypothetical protein [Caudoviricetes sp.]DAW14607.1 MAG TPA: hypothetical protein [Caudoviricetes sp.]